MACWISISFIYNFSFNLKVYCKFQVKASRKSAVCRTINNSSAERSNSMTTPCTNVGRSCLGRNKVTKYSPPIGNYKNTKRNANFQKRNGTKRNGIVSFLKIVISLQYLLKQETKSFRSVTRNSITLWRELIQDIMQVYGQLFQA